jgi:DNA polymerase III delta prime subunit
LILDKRTGTKLSSLIQWFTPSDSNVQDPSQLKKVFDLNAYAETTRGFPAIISYSWHEIAKRKFSIQFSKKFWKPHFNYMDFEVWHEFIAESDIEHKNLLLQEIKKQLGYNVRILDQLRRNFQSTSRHLISNISKPTTAYGSKEAKLSTNYHYIAQLWFIFAKLTASVDELEALYFRTMYPEFSIGKLAAAKVSALKEFQGKKPARRYYKFRLMNLSSNMKINEGDTILLFPSELRNQYVYPRRWEIKIYSMSWNESESCYDVITQESSNRLYESLHKRLSIVESEQWYLYPKSIDAWSTKLYRSGGDGLLQRLALGTSWLGERLAFKWNLIPDQKLTIPDSMDFGMAEIYMFAPELLENFQAQDDTSLLTNVIPFPDISQQEAIVHSLARPISVIVGPPGTGKSQTIVALIDEFLCQRDQPARILVTSFSYPAMRVVIEKLRTSKYQTGPSKASLISKVFIRSEFQIPILNSNHAKTSPMFVHDLVRSGNTWKLNDQSRTIVKNKKLDDHFPSDLIVFANAHLLYRLREKEKGGYRGVSKNFHFDLIIIDEASQLPTDHILSSLQFVNDMRVQTRLTKPFEDEITSLDVANSLEIIDELNPDTLTNVVIVGDHNQLPPVQPIKPPINLKSVLGSLFEYYITDDGHNLKSKQLKINYRSHNNIVNFTSNLGFYENLSAFVENADRTIKGEISEYTQPIIKEAMIPARVVNAIIHQHKFEVAVSPVEAEIAVQLIITYYKMINPQTREAQIAFWENEVGVVAPHNAQGRLIIRKVYEEIKNQSLSLLSDNELMVGLRNTIYSVEKFQGSDRTFIIASVGISSKDQLSAEEEFIYDLTRFNVLTSRAKSKIILIASANYLNYYPSDRDVADFASKIHYFANEFCNKRKLIDVTVNDQVEKMELRWFE